MGRMSGCPAGAPVSIRFDGSRCCRARHQDRRASAPMARAKRGPSIEFSRAEGVGWNEKLGD